MFGRKRKIKLRPREWKQDELVALVYIEAYKDPYKPRNILMPIDPMGEYSIPVCLN